jgi:hypothetical protein
MLDATPDLKADNPDFVPGRELGLAFPTNLSALAAGGAEFLTEAFRSTGAIAPDNRVTGVTRFEEFFGGGMGRKALLSVTYAKPERHLHQDLFVKLPRDFGDPLREGFAPLMAPEARLALLSRRPDFPVRTARCYFADFDPQSCTGLLITERIAYGQNRVEPALDKCLDYELTDPAPHYSALARALGALAGSDRAGRLGDIDASFPFEYGAAVDGDRIPFDGAELDRKLERLRQFAEMAPRLFQAGLEEPAFLDRFAAEAPLVLAHEPAIRAYLAGAPDYIALCHWNMNLDNAWFWRDPAGELQVGLLDWGGVGRMNIANALFGLTCGAELDFIDAHRGALIRTVVEAYGEAGGPALDPRTLDLMNRLAIALLGLAWMMDAPAIVASQAPDYARAADRRDPIIRDDFLARAQLQLLMGFLNAWRSLEIGETLEGFGRGIRA